MCRSPRKGKDKERTKTMNETIKKVENELAALAAAKSQMCRRMHYSTIRDYLLDSKLPYTLWQEWKDELGNYHRNYRYRWNSKWDSPASLYIQETAAGRSYDSMWKAMDALEKVLTDYLNSLKRAAVWAV